MSFLRATRGLEPGRVCELKTGTLILGRNPKRCDVVLEHYAVSREHARIDTSDESTFVEDLHSRNGVLVNGLPIQPGTAGRQRLLPNDRIEIAAFEFIFEEETSGDSVVLMGDDQDTKPDILSTVNVSADATRMGQRKGRTSQLQMILSIIEDLSNAIDPEDVFPRVIDSLFRSFRHTQAAYLLLRNRESGEFEPAAVRRIDSTDEPICISRAVVDEVMRNRTAVLSGDSVMSAGVPAGQATQLRSMICTPLCGNEGEIFGLIHLEIVDGSARFTEEDLNLLANIARHVAIVIENSRLHDDALRAQQSRYEQRFRRLIESSVQGVLIHRDFRPLFVNEAWAQLHGLTVTEVLQMKSVLPLIAEEDRDRAATLAGKRMRGGDVPDRGEIRARRKDGTVAWLAEFSTLVEWDGGPAIQTAVVDITALKEAEAVLRQNRDDLERRVNERALELAETHRRLESEMDGRRIAIDELRHTENLYHSLVEHIPLAVARKNLEGNFTFVNRSLCELFGKQEQEILGATDFDISPAELAKKYRRDDNQVIETGELLELFETVQSESGELRHIHTLKTPTYDAAGRCNGTQLIFSDVTSVKQAEEERNRYAEELERSNAELEQFGYMVSHDLQSPLRTVATYCQMLQRRYRDQLDTDAMELLDGAVDGVKRMKRLLDDLLEYARVATNETTSERVSADEMLDEALHNLKALILENNAEVTHDPLPTVTADATQLMQLFQNLIGNAIRYRGELPPQVHVSVEERSHDWVFQVADNGIGIDEKQFERIFQIFQRLHGEQEIAGSGVGLAICKRIVERHGGRIWVTSREQQGSQFYFSLPKR